MTLQHSQHLNMLSQCEENDACTLFVGEGDFSFSASYILKTGNCKERIFATCLNSGSLTERQQNNVKIIKENGGLVYTDVDATSLESHPEISKLLFSKIIFNFPHIPGKMNIRQNRQLVQKFFTSSVKIMEDTGTIYVTLCQGQGGTEIEKIKRKWCDTWQIVCLAASASLILSKVKCFDENEFKTYRCTGFRGLQKPFNTSGALTHIFKRGKPVEVVIENTSNDADPVDIYIQECIALNKFINRNLSKPSFKVLSILNSYSMKIFESFNQVAVDDLLTCRQFPSLNFDSFFNIDVDYCKVCISQLFSLFLRKKSSSVVTSVSCNLCCLKNIDPIKLPIHHLLSYFSDDAEILLTTLPIFLRDLTHMYTLNREKEKFAPENKSFQNKNIISSLICNNQKSVCKVSSVRCVANMYAKYSVHKGDELFFYTDVDFFLSNEVLNSSDLLEGDKTIKVGSVMQYNDNLEKLTCILLNLNTLSCLKYHVMDHRVLLSEESFYSSHKVLGSTEEVYRPSSLYPPTYVHDTSFYIEKDFQENDFFMVVKNTVGLLIKSVTLMDSYYDENFQKQSRCYRFVYQSCDFALSKEKANEIHTFLMRKALQNSLNICLR